MQNGASYNVVERDGVIVALKVDRRLTALRLLIIRRFRRLLYINKDSFVNSPNVVKFSQLHFHRTPDYHWCLRSLFLSLPRIFFEPSSGLEADSYFWVEQPESYIQIATRIGAGYAPPSLVFVSK